jgi:hypothetical protein
VLVWNIANDLLTRWIQFARVPVLGIAAGLGPTCHTLLTMGNAGLTECVNAELRAASLAAMRARLPIGYARLSG